MRMAIRKVCSCWDLPAPLRGCACVVCNLKANAFQENQFLHNKLLFSILLICQKCGSKLWAQWNGTAFPRSQCCALNES